MRLRSAFEDLRARLPRRLRWEPWSVLVPLIVLQWLVVAHVARYATHNGWFYFHDRTGTWSYTTAWIVGGGHVPLPYTGYGWPLLLAPVTWFSGPSSLSALHVILPLQIAVLVPLGALGAYVLGARSAGRLVGYFAAAVWTLGPLASLWYFPRPRWLDEVLPTVVGLTELRYLPAILAVLLAGVLVLRALDERRLVDAAAAGVAAGFAIAIEPTNIVFVAAPLVAFGAARRSRELGAFAGGLAPCLLTYLLWRERGLGHIGTLSQALLLPGPTGLGWRENLQVHFIHLQSASWSPRVLEWIAIAGFVALLKRSPVKSLFFGTWLVAYVLLGSEYRTHEGDGLALWHVWMPAFPAFCVLIASLPLLWPGADRRVALPFPYRPRRFLPLAVPALAVLGIVVPLAAVAALPVLHDPRVAAEVRSTHEFVPLDRGPRATAQAGEGHVTLSWPAFDAPAKVTYTIYRTPPTIQCSDERGAMRCVFAMARLATTRDTTFSERPPTGAFTYRVAVTSNSRQSKLPGTTILIGPPVRVRAS
jgi:hypothetical protein